MNLQNTPELAELFKKKQEKLLSLFPSMDSQTVYEKIIELGRSLPSPIENIQNSTHLIEGCQSEAYLASSLDSKGNIEYQVFSEALISAGLAALLLMIYNKEPLALILFYPPTFPEILGFANTLSPGRSNGFASMYARMKSDALKLLVAHSK